MIKTGQLLSVARVVGILSHHLGDGRQWVDALNDHRQCRGSIKGITLLPFGSQRGDREKSSVPLYHVNDVVQFITEIRLQHDCKKPFDLPIKRYSYDDTDLISRKQWRIRTVTPVPAGART